MKDIQGKMVKKEESDKFFFKRTSSVLGFGGLDDSFFTSKESPLHNTAQSKKSGSKIQKQQGLNSP